jgi:ketosteroid isomerase-like protein
MKKILLSYLLSSICILCIAATGIAQTKSAVNKQEVLARQAAFAETIKRTAWNELGNFLADSVIYIHSFGRVDTRDALIKNISRFIACKQWENKDITITIHSNTAIVHSNLYVSLTQPDGIEQLSQQRATDVWVKTKGNWWLLSHQSTSFK